MIYCHCVHCFECLCAPRLFVRCLDGAIYVEYLHIQKKKKKMCKAFLFFFLKKKSKTFVCFALSEARRRCCNTLCHPDTKLVSRVTSRVKCDVLGNRRSRGYQCFGVMIKSMLLLRGLNASRSLDDCVTSTLKESKKKKKKINA